MDFGSSDYIVSKDLQGLPPRVGIFTLELSRYLDDQRKAKEIALSFNRKVNLEGVNLRILSAVSLFASTADFSTQEGIEEINRNGIEMFKRLEKEGYTPKDIALTEAEFLPVVYRYVRFYQRGIGKDVLPSE